MRRKFFAPLLFTALLLCLLCSCSADGEVSVKAITKPYINEYVCTYGRLGELDLLENTEYIKVTILDGETLEVSFKKDGGKRHAFECGYTVDDETGGLCVDFGIFGAENKPRILIKDGKFSVNKQLGNKLLVMVFEVK